VGRDETIALLRQHMPEIRGFGVSRLAVFGSFARGEDRPDSDVDMLVEFEQSVGLFTFVRLQRFLAELIGRPVDLAMPGSLRPEMRQAILAEAVYAAYGMGISSA